MALSDFLPYGAPELLEGASVRLARSTMTASLAVAMLVVAAGALLSRQVTVVISPEFPGRVDDLLNVQELQPPPKVESAPPSVKIAPPDATPNPVSDARVREVQVIDPPPPGAGPVGEGSSEVHSTGGATSGGGVVPAPPDPAWNEFVYTDEMPALVRCKEPIYPEMPHAAGVEGTVHVLMLVGLTGKVERAIIAPRGSVPMLDQAALDAALTCVFTPALANGHPVKVWVSQSYRFSLH